MKKTALIILALISALNAGIAQNVDDALRYSQIFYNGTARFMSMGGAFTALGGDISSLNQNPAGIGVFRSSEISVSPQLFNFRSQSNFNGNNTEDFLYDFNLGNAGIVLNLKNNQSTTGLVTLNFGYSYSRNNNFNESINIDGKSEGSSLLDHWAEKIDGIVDTLLEDNIEAADAYLGWYTWLLDPVYGTNDTYGTVYTNYGSYPADYDKNMSRVITNTGYTGEHAISLGGNFSNKLYLGATLGITRLEYESTYQHSEKSDSMLVSGFTDFNYTYYYRNWGTGYSLKLGIIYKPVEPLRLGFTFNSPGMFLINEYLNDNIVSNVDGKVEDELENKASWFKYWLRTPFRATIGVAYQVKKLGVVSAEYEFVDYGMARFSVVGDDDYTGYPKKNQEIKSTLKSTGNIRVGAEARLNRLYFRGGYGYYGKAYKTGDVNQDICYNSYSGGIGFREQNINVDFGFTRFSYPEKYILYKTSFEAPSSDIDIARNIFTISFGYKFGY
ncbi:MAG: hypothetical protein MUF36_01235 [Bacteroidales bacterium]|jgi:hypothetical protein|nr:hypothetical protein [Bacteroidales bacterium]